MFQLVCVPVGNSSGVGIIICAITVGIKKFKSIIKKKSCWNSVVKKN